MVSPFELTIKKLAELGFFSFFLPFLMTLAVFYGLLRRSQVFGKPEENIAVNAIVALVAAFMVWAYPILAGVDIATKLSTFLFQGTIAMLTVLVGLLIGSMVFPEGLGKALGEKFKGGGFWAAVLVLAVLVGFGVFLASGLSDMFFQPGVGLGALSQDILITVFVLILLIVTVGGIVVAAGGKPEEKK